MAYKLKTCLRCGKMRRKYHRRGKSFDAWCVWCRKEHNQTPERKAASVYKNMKRRALNSCGLHPTYVNRELRVSYPEFKEWYVDALTAWREANPNKRDSIDRIDNDGHYELENMQILELAANVRKRPYYNKNIYAPTGMGWCCDCKGYKALTEFPKSKTKPNGHEYLCKYHKNVRCRAYRKKIKERKNGNT